MGSPLTRHAVTCHGFFDIQHLLTRPKGRGTKPVTKGFLTAHGIAAIWIHSATVIWVLSHYRWIPLFYVGFLIPLRGIRNPTYAWIPACGNDEVERKHCSPADQFEINEIAMMEHDTFRGTFAAGSFFGVHGNDMQH